MARLERDREVSAEAVDSASATVPATASLALAVLVALAVLSPWALGAVTPVGVRVVSATALVGAAAVAIHQALRGAPWVARVPLGPLAAFVLLGLVQLLPLPPFVHALVAPGSAAVWHPKDSPAAAVLGPAWRPITVDPEATHAWLGLAGGLISLALLAAPALAARTRLLATAWILAANGAALAAYAVVARATFGALLYGSLAVPTVAPFGPFVNKNHFAGYVAMCALVATGLGRGLARQAAGASGDSASRTSALALAAFAAAAAMVMAVMLSLSRGGVLGVVAGLAVFAVIDSTTSLRPHPLARWMAPAAIGALIVALALVLPGEVEDRLVATRGREDASTAFRLDVWKDALAAWRASPVAGQGLGAFADILPRFKTTAGAFRVEHAEDEVLELAAEGGILGLGCVTAVLAALGARTIRAIRGHRDRVLRGVVAGALGGLAGLVVHGLVDFNLRIPSNALLFLLLGGLAAVPLGSARAGNGVSGTLIAGLAAAAWAAWWPASASGPALVEARTLALKAARTPAAAASALRLTQADRAARAYVAQRPADPEGWLLAAWAAARGGRAAEAAGLAAHAVALDPAREEVRAAAAPLAPGLAPPSRPPSP